MDVNWRSTEGLARVEGKERKQKSAWLIKGVTGRKGKGEEVPGLGKCHWRCALGSTKVEKRERKKEGRKESQGEMRESAWLGKMPLEVCVWLSEGRKEGRKEEKKHRKR